MHKNLRTFSVQIVHKCNLLRTNRIFRMKSTIRALFVHFLCKFCALAIN